MYLYWKHPHFIERNAHVAPLLPDWVTIIKYFCWTVDTMHIMRLHHGNHRRAYFLYATKYFGKLWRERNPRFKRELNKIDFSWLTTMSSTYYYYYYSSYSTYPYYYSSYTTEASAGECEYMNDRDHWPVQWRRETSYLPVSYFQIQHSTLYCK